MAGVLQRLLGDGYDVVEEGLSGVRPTWTTRIDLAATGGRYFWAVPAEPSSTRHRRGHAREQRPEVVLRPHTQGHRRGLARLHRRHRRQRGRWGRSGAGDRAGQPDPGRRHGCEVPGGDRRGLRPRGRRPVPRSRQQRSVAWRWSAVCCTPTRAKSPARAPTGSTSPWTRTASSPSSSPPRSRARCRAPHAASATHSTPRDGVVVAAVPVLVFAFMRTSPCRPQLQGWSCVRDRTVLERRNGRGPPAPPPARLGAQPWIRALCREERVDSPHRHLSQTPAW